MDNISIDFNKIINDIRDLASENGMLSEKHNYDKTMIDALGTKVMELTAELDALKKEKDDLLRELKETQESSNFWFQKFQELESGGKAVI